MKTSVAPFADTLKSAITTIYQAFPNLSYRPRPDDVKLLAAYMKSQGDDYPSHLDTLLEVENPHIELALVKYHNINKSQPAKVSPALDRFDISF
ncbi:hypothetical protein ACQKPX_03960 [Photobacterium sp. DNB23_23_1]|nr:hypothetical protein [Photobacterium sp. ZSDE20]